MEIVCLRASLNIKWRITHPQQFGKRLRVRQVPLNRRTWSYACASILAYVTYVGKYQKAYIRRYTFHLVIFLTIIPKLVIIKIEWKIANLAKFNIEVSFKRRIHVINLRTFFKKCTVWRECKSLFFSHL